MLFHDSICEIADELILLKTTVIMQSIRWMASGGLTRVRRALDKRSFWPSSVFTALNLISYAFAFNQPRADSFFAAALHHFSQLLLFSISPLIVFFSPSHKRKVIVQCLLSLCCLLKLFIERCQRARKRLQTIRNEPEWTWLSWFLMQCDTIFSEASLYANLEWLCGDWGSCVTEGHAEVTTMKVWLRLVNCEMRKSFQFVVSC